MYSKQRRKLWAITIYLCITTAVPYYCSIFLPNTAQNAIESFIKISFYGNETLTEDFEIRLSVWWSLFLAAGYMGILLGMIFAPSIADRRGRITTIRVAAIGEIPAHIFIVISQPLDVCSLLYVGRFLSGVGFGLQAVAVCAFLAEISPPDMRGRIVTCYPLFLCVGAVLGAVLGMDDVLGDNEMWSYAYLVPMFFSMMVIPLIHNIPDSPQYLGAAAARSRDYVAGAVAEDALRYYHGTIENLDAMMSNILNDGGKQTANLRQVFLLLRTKILKKPLSLTSIIAAASCFSGAVIILSLSTAVFNSAGLSYSESEYCTIGLKCVNFLTYLTCLQLVDRRGRRPLMIGSVFSTALCWTLIVPVQYFSSASAVCTVILIFLTSICMNIGVRPLLYVILNELFPYQYRAAANAWAGMLEYSLQSILGFFFWPLYVMIGNWVFLIMLAVPLWLLAVVLYRKCPETKGKSPNEVYPELASMTLHDEDFMPQPMRFGSNADLFHENTPILMGRDSLRGSRRSQRSIQVF